MRKLTFFFTAAFVGLLVLTYWTFQQLNFSPIKRTVVRLSVDNQVESLDPAKAFSDDSLVVSSQVLESLYQYHYLKRPYELQPLLADGMPQVFQKGKFIKIKLKRGVYYHDHPAFKGVKREVVAEDFVNQFKRLALESLKSPGRGHFSGLIQGFEEYSKAVGDDWKKIPSIELPGVVAHDPWTLHLQLNKPDSNINYYLALNFTVPVPWELIEYYNNELDQIMVGTGPYKYQGFRGDYYEMEKNRDYREDFYPSSGDRYANVQNLLDSSKQRIPFVDEVRFYVTSDESERWEEFMNKEFDLINVPKTFIPMLYDASGELNSDLRKQSVELKHFPILANRWLAFNMQDPVIGKNKHLRRAIAYGIDYKRYIKEMSQNTNLRANSLLVPGISGYRPAKDFRFRHDPELARDYLKKAAQAEGGELPTIIYSTRGSQAINLLEAKLIKEMLENIGLTVKIQVLSFSDFLRKGRAGELMFFTDVWLFDYPDGEDILQLLVSTNFPGINKSGYRNEKADQLYGELKQTSNQDQRDKIIQQMEELVFEDLPWIPMMYESSFVVQYPHVKNYRKSSIIRNYVKYLKIER